MNILALKKLFPEVLEIKVSPINGEIKVIKQFGQVRLMVAGLTQSGPVAEKVWQEGIKQFLSSNIYHLPSNILILGLGGGSLAKVLSNYFPRAKITGVEIDPIMVDFGEKYLGVSKVKNLKIILADGVNFVKKTDKKFNLIFVDLYIGDKVPKSCQTKNFLKNLKKTLKENGIIVFNRLYFKNHIFEAKNFLDKLKKIFNDVSYRKVLTNLLIFAKNSSGNPPSLKLRRA